MGVKPENAGKKYLDWETILSPTADPTTPREGELPGCPRTPKLPKFVARNKKSSKSPYDANVTSNPIALTNSIIWSALKLAEICPWSKTLFCKLFLIKPHKFNKKRRSNALKQKQWLTTPQKFSWIRLSQCKSSPYTCRAMRSKRRNSKISTNGCQLTTTPQFNP